jgi:hypothetical protein
VVTANTRATDSDRNDTCQVLDFALGEGQLSMEEHRQRVSAATTAITLGELQSLVSDLQIHSAPTQLPKLKSPAGSWGIGLAVAVVLTLLAAGIAWGLFGSSPSPSPTSKSTSATSAARSGNAGATLAPTSTTPAQAPPPQLLTLGGLTGFLAQMQKQFGDTMGYELDVYPEYAVLRRPDAVNAHKTVMWYYGKDGWANEGNHSQPSDTTLGDLAKFDVQAILGLLRDAPQTLHVGNAAESYILIESGKSDNLSLAIHVSDPDTQDSGYILAAADGTVERINPAGS